jgi:hypothetical protein
MKWISDRWHDCLVLLHLRPDFRNPDNAPPAFHDNESPHLFKRGDGSLVCVLCGGGRLHSVHTQTILDANVPPLPARYWFPKDGDQVK